MSRTYAHTPLRVRLRGKADLVFEHRGCELDDKHPEGRLVGYRTERIVVPGHFGERTHQLHEGQTRPQGWTAGPDGWRWFACDGTRCDVQDGRWRYHRECVETGWIDTYIEVRNVPIFEVVPCDALDATNPSGAFRGCRAWSDEASTETYGYRHRCRWPRGAKRAFWYAPERAQARAWGRRAAAEYNTLGELEDFADEPGVRRNPRGLWGGGWID